MQLTKEMAEKQLAEMGMSDMPLTQFSPTPSVVAPDWFQTYKRLCHEFTLSLTDSVEELAFLNLTQEEFMSLITGHGLPPNLSFRFRIPLVWGGQLTTENLFMCWTFPHSHNLDRFILSQSDADIIWLPNPVKKIYVPTHSAAGGDGGNATSDRLSQMAAQIAADRGIEV